MRIKYQMFFVLSLSVALSTNAGALENKATPEEITVRSFLSIMMQNPTDSNNGMPFLSKEYFESRWLDRDIYLINFFAIKEYRILKVDPPYVDVKGFSRVYGWTKYIRFKVVKESDGKYYIFPSSASVDDNGMRWVDPWWGLKQEDQKKTEKQK